VGEGRRDGAATGAERVHEDGSRKPLAVEVERVVVEVLVLLSVGEWEGGRECLD
jgi:hypothetical protein